MSIGTKNIIVEKAKTSKIGQIDFDNLAFGQVFTDHMFVCDFEDGKWHNPKIVPYQPISLEPSAKIFHYGQSIFEGMKAYKDKNDDVFLFRPLDNCRRLNISAKRLAIPEVPENYFMEGLKTLLKVDREWIPKKDGKIDDRTAGIPPAGQADRRDLQPGLQVLLLPQESPPLP